MLPLKAYNAALVRIAALIRTNAYSDTEERIAADTGLDHEDLLATHLEIADRIEAMQRVDWTQAR